MRQRIKAPPAPEVVEYLFKPRSLSHLERDFRLMMWINEAHALMLLRQGIVSPEIARPLLRALIEIGRRGVEQLAIDPNLEDLYLNFEHALIQQVGVDVGGRLHTGRSRNDLYATLARLAAREALIALAEPLFALQQALLERAAEHADAVMPGYTHLQPAQPTTFGHYLVSVALALERDGERLWQAYPRLNLSPLGACAFAGTGFAIDRQLTAHWLGFDGLVDSTLDAVASRDYVVELLAALAMLGVTLSRLAQDLYLWCSDEWGFLEVADDVAMTSSIMPQKKNPVTLEHIKAKAGHLLGALVAALAIQKNVNFMHCRDISTESVAPLWEAVGQAEAVLRVARRTLAGLTVRREAMRRRAAEDFCTATELADFLVRERGLPFRQAHEVVARTVVAALERGWRSDGITPALLERAAGDVLGRPLQVGAEELRQVLDSMHSLAGKRALGSPAAAETRRLIEAAGAALQRQRGVVEGWRARLQAARRDLDSALAAALAAAP
jgi:argininosuccinate lyase